MSLFSKLFGGGGGGKSAAPQPVEYNGFHIIPEPMGADGGFRLAARIEREVNGETRSHHLIRADVIRDRAEAEKAAIEKAKQMIDQQGERIFD